jgi:hypothetical protein
MTLINEHLLMSVLIELPLQAIATLPDLTEYAKKVDSEIVPAFRANKAKRIQDQLQKNIRYRLIHRREVGEIYPTPSITVLVHRYVPWGLPIEDTKPR